MAKRTKADVVEVSSSEAAARAADDPHHFDFDLDRGIREQVVEKLEASPKLPLAKGVGPRQSGIYALYHKGDLVYIGKATKETAPCRPHQRMSPTVGPTETEAFLKEIA